MTHDDAIEFPNGRGYTPCTREYADLTDKINALSDFGRIGMNDMSSADYEAFNRLLSARDSLQADGHTGKSVLYR